MREIDIEAIRKRAELRTQRKRELSRLKNLPQPKPEMPKTYAQRLEEARKRLGIIK